jgi:hypothetical protein
MPDIWSSFKRRVKGAETYLQVARSTNSESAHENRQYVDACFNSIRIFRTIHPYAPYHAITQERTELGKAQFRARLSCALYQIRHSWDCGAKYIGRMRRVEKGEGAI